MWERACALIKELREEYQFSTYEYDKLGDLLELQATLLKKILTETRFFAEYYRVAFYGKGFDKNVSVCQIPSDSDHFRERTLSIEDWN